MIADGQKVRFAIAVFYDIDRLASALHGFRDLGVGPGDIWLAGKSQFLTVGSLLSQALAGLNNGFKHLLLDLTAIGELPSSASLMATDGEALQFTQKTLGADGLSCLDDLMDGDTGEALRGHADQGAVIATVKTATPALQDACIRVLLRHSMHKVYSRECRLS